MKFKVGDHIEPIMILDDLIDRGGIITGLGTNSVPRYLVKCEGVDISRLQTKSYIEADYKLDLKYHRDKILKELL